MVDRKSSNHGTGQGEVQDPENDGRLKENRDSGGPSANRSRDEEGQFTSDDRAQSSSGRSEGSDWEPGHTGAVRDPEHDGRLKENREDGVTMGTTEHSAQAPHVKDNDDRDNSR